MPFAKGKSGNPGGRKKRTPQEFDLIKACRAKAPEALQVMVTLMQHGENDRVRLSAAIAVIERAYGTVVAQPPGEDEKPPVAVPVTVRDASTPEPPG